MGIYDFSRYSPGFQQPPQRKIQKDSLGSQYDFSRFSDAYSEDLKPEAPKSLGFWDVANNAAEGITAAYFGLAIPKNATDEEYARAGLNDDQRERIRNSQKAMGDWDNLANSLSNAGGDLAQIFTTKQGAQQFLGSVWEAIKGGAEEMKNNPGAVVGGVPGGILNMLVTPMSAILGTNLAGGGEVLDEDSRARAMKGSLALAAQMLISEGVGSATKALRPRATDLATSEGLVLSAVDNTVDNSLIEQVKRVAITSKKSGIARTIQDGIARGVLSGSAYGLIEGANEDDQINSVINNGLIFGTLGSVLDIFQVPRMVQSEQLLKSTADKISNWQQIKADRKDNLFRIIEKANILKGSDDFFAAITNDVSRIPRDKFTVIEGVTSKQINEFRGVRPDGMGYATRVDPETGMHTLAIIPPELVSATNPIGISDAGIVFEDTGYFPDELVYYKGEAHKVVGSDPLSKFLENSEPKITIKALHGNSDKTAVKLDEIRRATQPEIYKENYTVQRLIDKGEEVAKSQPNIQGYVGDNVEELNKGFFYHGGRNGESYGKEDLNPGLTNVHNLVGPGIYTTRDPEVAFSYAMQKDPNKRTLFKAQYKLNKVLDLEKPITPEVLDLGIAHIKRYLEHPEAVEIDPATSNMHPIDIQEQTTRRQLLEGMLKDLEYTKNEFSRPDGDIINGMEFYNKMKGAVPYMDGQFTQDFLYGFQQEMVKAGYDALTHIGGLRAGWHTPHQVVVLLDPANKYSVPNAKENPVTNLEHLPGIKPKVVESVPVATEVLKNSPATEQYLDTIAAHVYDALGRSEHLDFDQILDDEIYHNSDLIFPTIEDRGAAKLKITDKILKKLNGFNVEDSDIYKAVNEYHKAAFDPGSFQDYVTFHANTNNLDLVSSEDWVGIKDRETGEIVRSVRNIEDAVKLVNGIRQQNGDFWKSDLESLPPGSIKIPPTSDLANSHADGGGGDPYFKPTRTEKVFAQVNRILKYHTGYQKLFESIDISSGGKTKFLTDVFMKLQTARQIENANRAPWMDKVQKLSNESRGINNDRMLVISGWLETMHPMEVIERAAGRRMSKEEISTAQEFVKRGISEKNVLTYLRKSEGVTDLNQLKELQKNLKLDSPDGEIGIALFSQLKKLGADRGSLGLVTRLIRSYGGSLDNLDAHALSQKDWATKFKMTPKELALAEGIKKVFDDVAPEFGVSSGQMVNNYITHANLYGDGNMKIVMDEFNDFATPKERKFWKNLQKTNEIDKSEKHPIKALVRYINGGFNAKYFQDSLAEAKGTYNEARKTLKASGESVLADNAKDYWNKYVSDLRGWPDKFDSTVNDAVNKIGETFKQNWDVNVKRDLVNAITKTLEMGIQGGRLKAGLLDFYTGFALYSSRFGYKETAQMIVNGLKELPHNDLIKTGITPGLDINTISDPAGTSQTQKLTGLAGQTLDKVSSAALRLSGQKDIYNMFQQGAYITGLKRAESGLKEYRKDPAKPNLEKLIETAKLGEYPTPLKNRFLELVEANKDEQAANLLAAHTPRLVLPTYGNANNPYGWRNSFMRLGGQFGTYSGFARTTLQDMIAQGTVKEKFVRMSRFAASQAFLVGLSAELGLNLSNWYIHKSIVPSVGPAVQTGYNLAQSVAGNPYQQQQAQDELLRTLAESPIYMPFALLKKDIEEGNKAYEMGRTDSPINVRSFGIYLSKRDRSWNEVLGEDALGFLPDGWFKD